VDPGVREMPAEDYYADVGSDRPSLSSSIAHVLCTQSPRHAWAAHPRLNPNYERVEDERFDVGNAAHAMILEGLDVAERGEFPDWRTHAAKEWRWDVRGRGRIPLLAEQFDRALEMVSAVRAQLSQHRADPPLFEKGRPETVATWAERSVACRARLDWLRADLQTIDDLKTTSRSAEPQAYARNLYSNGGDIQAAFYRRGVAQVFGIEPPHFRWVVVETYPPYALSVIEPAADVLAVGDAKVVYALDKWAELLELEGEWPAYSLDVVRAELPPWEESKWLDRMEAIS
jgi:PDDEXK-like domain of unknown function (DUF3799)